MRRLVEQRVARRRAQVAVRLRAMLPGATVEEGAAGVTVSAPGLVRRWIDDPRLSWWRE